MALKNTFSAVMILNHSIPHSDNAYYPLQQGHSLHKIAKPFFGLLPS